MIARTSSFGLFILCLNQSATEYKEGNIAARSLDVISF